MRVIWSPRAVERVAEIADYIAADRPDAARRWVEQVFDLTKTLTEFPRRGRRVPELNRPEYRELIFGNYRVIYRVDEARVSIVTVRDGRRLFDMTELEDSG